MAQSRGYYTKRFENGKITRDQSPNFRRSNHQDYDRYARHGGHNRNFYPRNEQSSYNRDTRRDIRTPGKKFKRSYTPEAPKKTSRSDRRDSRSHSSNTRNKNDGQDYKKESQNHVKNLNFNENKDVPVVKEKESVFNLKKQIISLQKKSDLKAKTIQKTNDLEAKNKKLVEENQDLQNKLLDKEIIDGNKDDTNADFIDLKKKYEKLENTNRDLEKDLTRIRNERNNLKENSANLQKQINEMFNCVTVKETCLASKLEASEAKNTELAGKYSEALDENDKLQAKLEESEAKNSNILKETEN